MNNKAGEKSSIWEIVGICVFIALAVWMVFGQALGYGFVNYDDNKYVYENPMVQKGMTWAGFAWAFTYGEIGHWHPLTWLSHMLDCQLYGLNAYGHHLTNLLFHAATRHSPVSRVAADDRRFMAQRICRDGVCHPSLAGGVRGVGVGTQRRVERVFLYADPWSLCALCA